MHDIDLIVSTTIPTIRLLKKEKRGADALLLYFTYIEHARIQETNQARLNREFMKKNLGRGTDRYEHSKTLLEKLGLIEIIEKRDKGKFNKRYIKINFIIGSKFEDIDDIDEPTIDLKTVNGDTDNGQTGQLNAGSTITLNAGSTSSTKVEEEQSSIIRKKTIWEMNLEETDECIREMEGKNELNEEDIKTLGCLERNKCLLIIAKYNNGIVDGFQGEKRKRSKNLIAKLKKIDKVKSGKFQWWQTLEGILQIISENKYYCSKISGPEAICSNLTTLHNVCIATVIEKNKQQNTTKQF